ncbi:DUF4855 domain-containing protein [Paenibacillus motobuensis]|uniref:DUF4855 domain-containing protein n=1 Tax=Paenibacillus TaxID=44249 RepID=UPI00203BC4EC|nr:MULTISPECIES: DUF4855 domain-containing protein [Paenibacillus]MCM3041479.1 DUF4855 domain-containing protein [Paenibacillus lutimineralis]MCM3648583.1 DUF4855 domain-containing protein [Paenibacillus motobuensis]
MRRSKRWLSMVIITVMLFTLIPAAHGEEAASLQAGKQTGANEDGHVVLNSEQITQPDGQVPVDQEGGGQIDPVDEATQNPDQVTPPAEQALETEPQSVTSAVYDEPYNLALGLSYEWSEAPEAAYSDDNNKLTNGNYGELDISDPAWVGHLKKKTREVVFDLGDRKSITKIKANFMQDWPNNNVLMPLTVSMYVSDDKQNWGLLSHYATQTLWKDGQYKENYEWDGSKDGIKSIGPDAQIAYARYVKVMFSMHTKAMSFVDEIEIWGNDGQTTGAVTVPTQQPAFLAPGEATAGIKHLGLLYNGHYSNDLGTWKKERIIPNISYVDKAGEPTDWLFDGVLYLGTFSDKGRGFGAGSDMPSLKEDWQWYLGKTFAPEGDMYQLNEAAKEVGAKLSQPNQKEKVVLMIPYPDEGVTNFGDVDGDNKSENFKALTDRVKAVQWYLEEVKQRWEAANYSHLELVGMYWLEEQIGTDQNGPELVRLTSEKVHTMTVSGNSNMKFFWIPHFLAYKSFMWEDVGFDAVAFQPNYFFEPMDYDRLGDAANIAKRYGMTNEFEFDDRMLTDGVFRERYIDYLNSGVETGLMTDGFNAYYQGNNAVYNSAVSTDPSNRVLYGWLYQYVQGTYQINNAAPPEIDVLINGEPFQSGVVLPETESVQFTWKLREDDGLTKVNALFDGKAYAPGTVTPLAGKLGKHELLITVTSGKSVKTSYVVEASTNAAGVRIYVDRFAQEQKITDTVAVNSLNNYLDMMKRYEGKDTAQAAKYLKGFNAKLDQFMKAGMIKTEAYNTLKEIVYYLTGNLAQDKAVEASSTEGGNPNYVPAKAVDGFPASRWASDYVDNTWYQVDLGAAQEFNTIRIDWEYARAKTYKLLVSDDKKTWTNVMPNDGVITAQDGKETVQFSPVTARYIKFQGIERNSDYGYSFYEFGVYNLSGDAQVQAIDGLQATVDAASRKVTIDGMLMNGYDQAPVSLKVLDPKGKVHYEEQKISTAEGKVQFVFTLKGQLEGSYEAYVSTEGMVTPAKVSFEYKKADPGNGNGNGNGNNGNNGNGGGGGGSSVPTSPSTSVPVELKPQADGSVRAVISTKLDSDEKTAVGTMSEQDLQKAMAEVKADADGKLNITLEMNSIGDAANYALDLPASFFSEHRNLSIKVNTPKASVVLSGQMFDKPADLGKQMRLIIGEGNRQSLSKSAQAQVGSRPLIVLEVKMDGKSMAWKNEKAPVAMTIPYVRANTELASGLGILSINNQGVVNIIPGASYSDASKEIRFQVSQTGTYGVFSERSAVQFTDLGKHAWAQEAIEQLAALGIVKGTSAATFSPTEQVSRADFIVMLVRALDLKADGSGAFTDVQSQDYYYDAVSIAKQLGVVTGVDGDKFAPQGKITRQDMMVMAARAIQAAKGQEISGNLASLEGFKDTGAVADYAASHIAGMVEQGLIQGDRDRIKAREQATRAEAAVFLHRLLDSVQ